MYDNIMVTEHVAMLHNSNVIIPAHCFYFIVKFKQQICVLASYIAIVGRLTVGGISVVTTYK